MYVIVKNGVASYYTITDLIRDNPNVSFAESISEETLADFDVFMCNETEVPVVDGRYKVERKPPENISGQWTSGWDVIPLSSDELAAKYDAIMADNRADRNRRLAACDWTQLADVPLTADCKQAYAVYRQALRDADLLAPAWPAAPDEDWIV